MANIVINEVSANYNFNVASSSYCTVALPITASWGPGFSDSQTTGFKDDNSSQEDDPLEGVVWSKFPSTQSGLESFVSTFRGPTEQYIKHQDYSYQQAMSLIANGYDVLVCRVATGAAASCKIPFKTAEGDSGTAKPLTIKAKYLGSFGNNLQLDVRKLTSRTSSNEEFGYWNVIVYIVSSNYSKTAVENLKFVFNADNATSDIVHVSEIDSNFVTFETNTAPDVDTVIIEKKSDAANHVTYDPSSDSILVNMTGGTDLPTKGDLKAAQVLAKARYNLTGRDEFTAPFNSAQDQEAGVYLTKLNALTNVPDQKAKSILFREWMFNAAYTVLGMLSDRLTYNPQRVIVPGWDDADVRYLDDDDPTAYVKSLEPAPLHLRLMYIAYVARCTTAYLDIPRSLARVGVWNASTDEKQTGYAQKLSRNFETYYGSQFSSHSAIFAPWGKFRYTGTTKQSIASSSFLALLIDHAMISNQTSQYEWELPTSRKHNLTIGKLDYSISKKYLDLWQSTTGEGVGVNCISNIPDLGTTLWGNSTLFEVPPATYQALSNLSTRKLVNAVKDLAFKCGIGITFNYNNDEAYQSFYAGMTPLLDTMRNVGAINDYKVTMAADINGLDNVNANSVIGTIYLIVPGVINTISIDLVALPPSVSIASVTA